MLGSIKYNLSNLAEFGGRDARQTFWYYVLFLFIIQIAVGILTAIPMYIEMFSGAMEAAQQGASDEDVQAAMMGNVSSTLKSQIIIGSLIGLVSTVLLTASFVRRLHDSGKSGWFALLAFGPYLFSLAMGVINVDAMMTATQAAMTEANPAKALELQSEFYSYSMLSWVGYLIVIIFGVMKSTDGPNKYGDEPVRF